MDASKFRNNAMALMNSRLKVSKAALVSLPQHFMSKQAHCTRGRILSKKIKQQLRFQFVPK
jgi:hypothetical protein